MKLIFLDIDGTIVSFGHRFPSSSTVNAIKEAQKNGHKVFLNTGRCRCEVNKELEAIGFDGIICSNSLYIEENKVCLLKKDMPSQTVKEVSDWLSSQNVGFFFEGHYSVMATKLYFEQMESRFGAESILRMKEGFPVIKESCLSYDDVGKINFLSQPSFYKKLKKEFGSVFQINEWSFLGDDKGMGEITLLEASKAEGVKFMLERHCAKKEDTISFGDTKGDLSMIKFCETGVAMGNAEKELKEAANYITNDVDDNGIEKAFSHFGLI